MMHMESERQAGFSEPSTPLGAMASLLDRARTIATRAHNTAEGAAIMACQLLGAAQGEQKTSSQKVDEPKSYIDELNQLLLTIDEQNKRTHEHITRINQS